MMPGVLHHVRSVLAYNSYGMNKEIITSLKNGGVGVIPTDTIYGIVCLAHDKQAVEKVYALKRRDAHKPMIVIAANRADVLRCGVQLDDATWSMLEAQWRSQPSSIILPADDTLKHVHRDKQTVAIRVPYSNSDSMELLRATGPLVATSVNISGVPPLHGITDIKREFPHLDFYLEGDVAEQPSQLYQLQDTTLQLVRR